MAVLAAAGFAAITLTGARPVPGLDDLAVTGFGFTIGGLVLMPLAEVTGGIGLQAWPRLPSRCWPALGTGPTAVAYAGAPSAACGPPRRARPPCWPCSSR